MRTAKQVMQAKLQGATKAKPGNMTMRERRESMGLSQEDVGEALGVTATLVSRWETGSRSVSLRDAFILAAFYETTVDELFSGLKPEAQS